MLVAWTVSAVCVLAVPVQHTLRIVCLLLVLVMRKRSQSAAIIVDVLVVWGAALWTGQLVLPAVVAETLPSHLEFSPL